MRSTYKDKVQQLIRAMDIAKEILISSDVMTSDQKVMKLEWMEIQRMLILDPEPEYKNSKSLKFLETDFLTYWNEAGGPHVEIFWERLEKESINFKRKNIIREVLNRKRIKDIHEFDHIIDSFVIAQQTGRMSNAEAQIMSTYIQEFESRRRK